MAYLNEDGLETLVGKIKGQVIELTSAEYRQLPATKNTDNKLYFVNDEAYAYQIDDEPTSGSSGLVKSGGVYNWTSKIGSGTLTTTAQTLIPAVNELNAKIGSTDISSIGDGTVTGAVDTLNNGSATTIGNSTVITKTGKIVSISLADDDISALLAATIPAEFRPSVPVRFLGNVLRTSDNHMFTGRMSIETTGTMRFFYTDAYGVTDREFTVGTGFKFIQTCTYVI